MPSSGGTASAATMARSRGALLLHRLQPCAARASGSAVVCSTAPRSTWSRPPSERRPKLDRQIDGGVAKDLKAALAEGRDERAADCRLTGFTRVNGGMGDDSHSSVVERMG